MPRPDVRSHAENFAGSLVPRRCQLNTPLNCVIEPVIPDASRFSNEPRRVDLSVNIVSVLLWLHCTGEVCSFQFIAPRYSPIDVHTNTYFRGRSVAMVRHNIARTIGRFSSGNVFGFRNERTSVL